MKRILFFCLSIILITSCAENSAEYKKLQSENERLKVEKAKTVADLDNMISTLTIFRPTFKPSAKQKTI